MASLLAALGNVQAGLCTQRELPPAHCCVEVYEDIKVLYQASDDFCSEERGPHYGFSLSTTPAEGDWLIRPVHWVKLTIC